MRVGFVCGLAGERRIVERLGGGALYAVTGAQAARTETCAQDLIARGAQALVSFGVAGGLDPTMREGDVVVSAAVTDGTETWSGDARWAERVRTRCVDGRRRDGALLQATTAVSTPREKAGAFARTGAVAVDMESAGVARAATAANLSFIVVRAIADTATHRLPPFAATAIDADGRSPLGPILRGLAADPASIASLVSLAFASRRAFAALRGIAPDIGEPDAAG
jgi:adenosylhomocysteine nucleosidase